MEEASQQDELEPPEDYFKKLYRRHYQGALVRSGASTVMWLFALASYLANETKINHFTGVTLSVLYLIAINPPTLLILKRLKNERSFKYTSLLINILEIIGYTAIIYSLGGIEATFLTPIYAALIVYVGVLGPKNYSYFIASICSLAFGFVVAGEYFGFMPPQRIVESFNPPELTIITRLAVVIGLLFVVAYISDLTSKILNKSKQALLEQNTELSAKTALLDKAKRALRESQKSLEKLVEERTLKLKTANEQLKKDIIKRKQVEAALRKSEEKYRLHFENVSDVIYSVDKDLKILSVSPSVEKLLGYRPEEIVGKPFQDINILAPAYLEKAYNDVTRAFSGDAVSDSVYEFTAKDGTEKFGEVSGTPVYHDGEVVSMLSVARDISEKKYYEDQLRQAQKMESVGRLAGGVAHDFNNMLGVILGHTELALLQTEENHDLYSDLKEIQKAANRSADITNKLLAFARKQTISPRQLDLNDTVESMLNMLRRLIGENIELAWQPASHIWPVKMDPSQIDQILANLCINARDAIDGVGKLTIETGRKSFDEEYCKKHAGFIPGDFVLLAVSDNGSGMDKDTLDNLFEPFFTTKEVGKGTGLGLATIYGIVKQNNGFINVYSEPGRGSTFKIYLPRLVADEDIEKAEPEKKAAVGGTETILLVEDEPSILRMTRMMLERKGYTVLSSATPSEAVEKAKKHPSSIDLLMTDVVMPEMNGKDLAEQVTVLYPDIRFLFMSGYTADVIAYQGVLDAGVAFIQKPFSMADMTEKVREVLDMATDKNYSDKRQV